MRRAILFSGRLCRSPVVRLFLVVHMPDTSNERVVPLFLRPGDGFVLCFERRQHVIRMRGTTCSDHSAGKEHVSDGSICFLSVAIPGRNPAAPWARLISCNRSSPFNGLRAISMSCLEIASNAWDRMSPVNTIAGVFEARAARNASNSWGQRDSNRTVSGEVVCLDL